MAMVMTILSLEFQGRADRTARPNLSYWSFIFKLRAIKIRLDIPNSRYSKIPKKGKRPEYDVGRVIVLLQENGKLDDKSLIEIKGIDIYGQFGFDIRKGGDLNNDDIDDVIISAPYAGWDRQGSTNWPTCSESHTLRLASSD